MYLLTLPIPPSINAYYGYKALPNSNRVIKYVKKEGKEYKTLVKEYIASQNLILHANIPLKATMVITKKSHRKLDIDNTLKCLFDSLTEAQFWVDDSLIEDLHITYQPPSAPGSILLHVEPLRE